MKFTGKECIVLDNNVTIYWAFKAQVVGI